MNQVPHTIPTVFPRLAWGIVRAGVVLVNRVERGTLAVDAQGCLIAVSTP
ncbi:MULTISPECIES: hypothetical protein [unclassified Streptomyces]